MSTENQECVLQSLAHQNDELLEKYMADLLGERLADSVSEYQRRWKHLILMLQGLPARQDVLQLEAVVLYNYGIANIHNNCLHVPRQSDNIEMEVRVKRFLQRIGCQKKGHSLLEYLPREGTKEIQNDYTVAVLMVHALNCFQAGDAVLSHDILQHVSRCLPKLKVPEDQKNSALSFPIEGLFSGAIPKLESGQLHELTSSAYLALALTSAKTCKYPMALSYLESVALQSYTDHIAIIKGYCLYKQRSYSEALSSLNSRRENISRMLKDAFCYLKALCFYKQHKVELAVQQLKHCLLENFDGQSISLHLLSQLFETVGMRNVQMATQRLLVTKLKREEDEMRSKQKHLPQMTLNLFLCSLFNEKLALNEALYNQAKTCFMNERFETAGTVYLELIDNLLKSGLEYLPESEGTMKLPPVATVIVESAEALVKSCRPKEAVAVCNHLLERSSDISILECSILQSSHIKGIQKKAVPNLKKRQLSESETESCNAADCNIPATISILSLKAESLLMLDDPESALQCINRCLSTYEDYCDRNDKEHGTKQLSPPRKCQKLEEGTSSSQRQEDPLVDHIMPDVYSCMARILMAQKNHQSALHWSRMALTSKPEKKAYQELHASITSQLTSANRAS